MANGYLHHQGTKFYPAPYYPIGAVYMSVDPTDPKNYFGGTWTRIQGKFLWATGSTPKTEGGSTTTNGPNSNYTNSTVLGIEHIPSHQHTVYDGSYSGRYVEISGFNDTNGGMVPSIRQISGAGTNSGRLFAGPVGGGQGHNHYFHHTHTYMPPYFEVYMWYRIA